MLPHLEAKIVDPVSGMVVPFGCSGEYLLRGYSVMKKYWNDEEGTRKAIDENGYMRSGDIGIMDEEGYVTIVGRLKDMIIRGGENVSPKEIEDFLV